MRCFVEIVFALKCSVSRCVRSRPRGIVVHTKTRSAGKASGTTTGHSYIVITNSRYAVCAVFRAASHCPPRIILPCIITISIVITWSWVCVCSRLMSSAHCVVGSFLFQVRRMITSWSRCGIFAIIIVTIIDSEFSYVLVKTSVDVILPWAWVVGSRVYIIFP